MIQIIWERVNGVRNVFFPERSCIFSVTEAIGLNVVSKEDQQRPENLLSSTSLQSFSFGGQGSALFRKNGLDHFQNVLFGR